MIQSIWELFNVSASQTGKYQTEQGALSLKQEGGKEFDSRAGHIPEKDEPMSLHNARLLPDDTDNSHTIILNSKGQAGKDRLKAAGCQALGAKHGPQCNATGTHRRYCGGDRDHQHGHSAHKVCDIHLKTRHSEFL